MYDHDIRWYVLVPVALIIGLGALFLETSGIWGRMPARPDFFWCLACYAVLRTSPIQAVLTFTCVGLFRDFLLGPKPGATVIAYIIIGWVTLYWKPMAEVRRLPGQALMVGLAAAFAAGVKHSLDYGALAYKLLDWVFIVSVGDGILTCAAYVPVAVVLSLPPFRPWREKGGYLYS